MSPTLSTLITARAVDLDLSAPDKEAATRSLAERLVAEGRITDLDGFLADVAAREAQMPTGLEGGIGIPHCRSAHVTAPSLAFGRVPGGVDFGAPDGPADLVFLIAAPEGGDADHLQILSTLARKLMDSSFTTALREAGDAERAAALIRGDVEPGETGAGETGTAGEAETAGAAPAPAAAAPLRLVAVTSCPTGIAHTYMAAEAITQAARAAGYEIAVETQGSAGADPLDPKVIKAADAVIFAADLEVRDRARFRGKPLVQATVKQGVNSADDLVARAARYAETARAGGSTPVVADDPSGPSGTADGADGSGEHWGSRLKQWLMTGVSYMIPFVAAGGLLIALGFLIGGYEINKAPSVMDHFVWTEKDSWAALLFQTGGATFTFLVPVLAGYIAFAIADRPGLVPGIVGGYIASQIGAGFLGGLAAGLLAGAVVMGIRRLKVPKSLQGIMPVVVIPLLSAMVVGALMFLVVGKPIAWVMEQLTDWLNGLSGSNAVLLGILLGLMMCFDLGGPINKVAYTFAVSGISVADPTEGGLKVMAAVMAAGMVPPLALALATTVRRNLFTTAEQENGKAAWVLGASFISEGAIPFAAADPLRVIPASMAGGAVTGALSMAVGSTLRAPHGGVFVVPLIGRPFLYLLAIAAGTAVSAVLVIVLKSMRKEETAPAAGEPEQQPGKVGLVAS
ncbi:fructose-specific PTS transporter subunit EIIC [Streptomyces capparidis]